MTNEEIKSWLTTNHPNYKSSIDGLIIDICDYKYYENGDSAKILKYCNNVEDINILNEIISITIDRHKFWLLIKIVSQCLDELKIDISTLISFLRFVYLSIKNDLHNGILHNSIENYCKKHSDEAKNIIGILESTDEEFSYFFIVPFIVGLSMINFDDGINTASKFLDNENEKLICSGLKALSLLKYNDTDVLKTISHKVTELSKTKIPNIVYGAIEEYYCQIWFYDKNIISLIKELQKLRIPEVDFQVSLFLFRNTEEIIKHENDFNELLLNLTDTDYKYNGIIQNLDHILFYIYPTHTIWDDFLSKWISFHDINISGSQKLTNTFQSFTSKFLDDPETISRLITIYFNSEKSSFHHAAADLISFFHLHNETSLPLNLTVLSSIEDKDCVYISGKVIGYIFDFDNLITLIFSILAKENISDDLCEKILDKLLHVIAPEYPHQLKHFLEEFIKNDALTEENKQLKIAKLTHEALEKYYNNLSSLPLLNEFKISSQKLLKIQIIRNKKMNEVMKRAQEKSVFSQLATQISIKYGKGTFHLMNGAISNKSNMAEFSTAYSLPTSIYSDPIGNEIMYAHFRLEKKDT